MSLYSAMRAGVTGIGANASAMALIADNITNLNTVGYKRSQASFSALLNAQSGSAYNAAGIVASTKRFVDLQGSALQSSSPLDLAITGAGFFAVSASTAGAGGNGAMYTRAGAFSVDAEGYLRNSGGYFLLGAPLSANGAAFASLSDLQPIRISGAAAAARPTTQASISANLDSRTALYAGSPLYSAGAMAAAPAGVDAIAPQVERSIEFYDSLGTARTLTLGFIKTDVNTWSVEIYMRPTTDVDGVDGLIAAGELKMSSNGGVQSLDAALQSIAINYAAETGVAPQTIDLDLSKITQFAQTSSLRSATADGGPPGTPIGVSVDSGGRITALYSNGASEPLFLIPLATFLNPNGLIAVRGGSFRSTLSSGQVTLNAPGASGSGGLQAFALETSNVDLAVEFTSMITVQRAYSACSRIITTADEMIDELIRIKRG
jgi:flagellar hook protein FlgE